MSGVTPLVDTLLATRLAQRIDLIPLKPQVEIAGPEAASLVDKAVNDVRSPSRAALEQLGADLAGNRNDTAGAKSSPSPGVTLSAAARAISAILGPQIGVALKIQSPEPLWPNSRPPDVQQLAAKLVQTVVYSGLFYESHLEQFAAGLRPLENMAREPQSGLLPALLSSALTDAPGVPFSAARPPAATSGVATAAAAGVPAALVTELPSADGQAIEREPQRLTDVYGQDGKHAKSLLPLREIAGLAVDVKASVSSPVADKDNSPLASAVHPDAVGLVRQQLELLSQPVFRWSGEAWPGAPMEWDIKEEPKEESTQESAATEGDVQPPSWTTHLNLTLPTLQSVQARLTLAGNTLLVRLTSDKDTTLAALDEARDSLAVRFDTLGLQLTALQVSRADAGNATGPSP